MHDEKTRIKVQRSKGFKSAWENKRFQCVSTRIWLAVWRRKHLHHCVLWGLQRTVKHYFSLTYSAVHPSRVFWCEFTDVSHKLFFWGGLWASRADCPLVPLQSKEGWYLWNLVIHTKTIYKVYRHGGKQKVWLATKDHSTRRCCNHVVDIPNPQIDRTIHPNCYTVHWAIKK